MKLPKAFFEREDTLELSKQLLGKFLFTNFEALTGGMIVETEAYAGPTDRACHAFGNRRTKRTEVMFSNGGVSYIYVCYGIHHLFNVVTHKKDHPYAILIRAIEPITGLDLMLTRRKKTMVTKKLTAGPGALSQALGLHKQYTGEPLDGDKIWIEDRGVNVKKEEILALPRVGIDYAGEDALLPYRFKLANSQWTSSP